MSFDPDEAARSTVKRRAREGGRVPERLGSGLVREVGLVGALGFGHVLGLGLDVKK